ncbi:macrophage mannose receptor 1-like [Larimichthys crocea]|uniref:macrophage mannose receptor 1-like n=1 Tax=Larimichthys crocea TaxID=215358 RepID=UPI000F5DB734|nr:macrophage mannose receptor 1-like [Larimichthys crocea]
MNKTLLFVLILSGLSALSTSILRGHHYIKILKTWAEAQTYCREKFIDLATINNQDDNDRLQRVLKDPGTFAWIGLQDDKTRWKWAMGNADFNINTDFSNWRLSEPNNLGSKQNCCVVNVLTEWFDFPCTDLRASICYDARDPSKYISVDTFMTWYDAKTYCRAKHTDLLTVWNKSVNDLIATLPERRHWMGLHRQPWAYWSDKIPTTFTNWDSGQPDNEGSTESCTAVDTTTGKWLDMDCEKKYYFVCQDEIQHQTTLKLKFQSETDLNVPAVQQQILEQLQTHMAEHELPHVKLRWIEKDEQTFHKQQKMMKEEEPASDPSLCEGRPEHPKT